MTDYWTANNMSADAERIGELSNGDELRALASRFAINAANGWDYLNPIFRRIVICMLSNYLFKVDGEDDKINLLIQEFNSELPNEDSRLP